MPPSESACCCGNKHLPVVYLPAHSPLITPQVSWKPACPPATPPMQSSSTLVNKASETLNHSPSQIAIFSQPLLITCFPGTLMENAPVPQPKNRTRKGNVEFNCMQADLFASNTNTSLVCSTCSWSLAKITANAFFFYYF